MKILDVPRSGSYQGLTSSRNRFGQYVRTRATPVNPGSVPQSEARSRLSAQATAWRTLTDNQRAGWGSLGAMMQRTDALGQVYTLTGSQAFVSVNSVLALVGDATVSEAPALVTPDAIVTVTPTVSAAAISLAFTPTPLAAGDRLLVYASPQRSAGRQFEGDYRLVFTGAAATASPADVESAYNARFGAQIVGNRIFFALSRYSGGFESAPLLVSAVVVA